MRLKPSLPLQKVGQALSRFRLPGGRVSDPPSLMADYISTITDLLHRIWIAFSLPVLDAIESTMVYKTYADWESSIKRALEALYKMRNVRIIEAMNGEAEQTNVTNLVLTHSEIAWDGFNIINKYPGSVKQRDNLFYHDGIHPIDAVHLALAKKTGCSAIATFDRDFRETNAEVPSILLMEDYF